MIYSRSFDGLSEWIMLDDPLFSIRILFSKMMLAKSVLLSTEIAESALKPLS